MASWRDSIVIRAPRERVFAYVDDPETLVEWLPGMVDVHDVVGRGGGQQQEWTYKMVGIPLRGQAVVVEHVPGTSAVHQTIGMVHSTFAYSVEPHEKGTRFTLEIDYTIPIPVLGRLAEHVVIARNAREFEVGLANLKELLEI
jgi:carbon monoxide dehydrogenase subunit G